MDPGVFSPGGWFDHRGGLTPERDQPGFFAFACALFCAGVFAPPEVCCQSLAGIHLRHSAVPGYPLPEDERLRLRVKQNPPRQT